MANTFATVKLLSHMHIRKTLKESAMVLQQVRLHSHFAATLLILF